MPEDAVPNSPQVVLGFDAAWGFAPADQTSPALAAAAGALVDVTMADDPVTELRIHGVSGSNGPTMLEHPAALQVAGDSVTGFFRRWSPHGPARPSVPWKLEAYSWGGLTEAQLASASWLLLAPFMMYNVAHFMLPAAEWQAVDPGRAAEPAAEWQAVDPGRAAEPAAMTGAAAAGSGTAGSGTAGSGTAGSGGAAGTQRRPALHLTRGPGHHLAHVLLRLLALAATLQLVSAITTVTVSMVAWQAAGRAGMLPSWMGWYASWTVGWRAATALLAVAAVVAVLWLISVVTAGRYEARTSSAEPQLSAAWPLTQAGFWKGAVLVSRQRRLHAAAAGAAAALLVAYPAGPSAPARWAALAFAAVVLAAAVGLVASPLADRHSVTMVEGGEPSSRASTRCNAVLAAAGVAVAASALVTGLTDQRNGPRPGALPGLTGFLLVLLVLQLALLIAFGGTVTVLAGRAPAADRLPGYQPYLRGRLAALITVLAFALGGLLTAVLNFGLARLLGTPVPSGFTKAPSNAVDVPWPVYAFGAVPVGLLAGGLLAAAMLYLRYRGNWQQFDKRADGRSPVAAAYPRDGDAPEFDTRRRAIARAWAVGLLADDAAAAVALIVGSGVAAVLIFEVLALLNAGSTSVAGWWHGVAALVSLLGVLVAGAFVTLLRDAYSSAAKRKTIGALWDVATFWPRAAHPFAPPCYGERAVPEVVDRITVLTGQAGGDDGPGTTEQLDLARTGGLTVPCGPVLLTGYSQGSIIAPAVAAQLPPRVRARIALLTLACPARRLYGRAFPAYFGISQVEALRGLLGGGGAVGRWKNLVRRSDYIGSWIFSEPLPRLDPSDLRDNIDQPCWDPVILVPDGNPTPPPTHRHSGWWPDPRTAEVGGHLVDMLRRLTAERPF